MNHAEIDHYIITRFNMPWVKEETDKPKGLDPQYLRERFELFDEYTVPSMKRQTCQNFKWLVFFDKRTPAEFLNKIQSYRELDFYEDVLVEPGFSLKEYIDDLKRESTGLFISSRVDNDDAVLSDYVEVIQKKAKEVFPKDRYLTSPLNYRYDVKDKTLTKYRLKKNHFISRTGNVFEVNQNHMPSNPNMYVKVPGIHSIEVVHESNLLNSTIYTFSGIIKKQQYRNLKKTLEYDLLESDIYSEFCKASARRDVFKTYKKRKKQIIKVLNKYFIKEKK